MQQLLFAYGISMLSMLVMDGVWLSLMLSRFYKPRMGELLAEKASFAPAGFFYLMYSFGVLILVLQPAFKQSWSLSEVFFKGALLGLLCYGTYDLTNQATLKNWPVSLTVVDMLWGALLTGSVALIAYGLLARHF